jgi:microcin C transport system substrate-binding protein
MLKLASLAPFANFIPLSTTLRAEDRVFRHAISLFNDAKYPPDFKYFDYVNPQAPHGGRLRMAAFGSFDSLNPYTFKGSAVDVTNNEALVTPSLDEPTTSYGLIAESMWFPDDRSMVVYRMRPEARFHDGTPMTPEDVIWSLQAVRDNDPTRNAYYADIAKAEQTGDHEVTFLFKQKNNRELPLITGEIKVLPKHWWTGKDAAGKARDISQATLEVPLGSGPYKTAEVKPGASILMRRVEDYWGKDLPVNVGQNNFDDIQTVFFLDANVEFEALKGDQYDFRLENSAKNWAVGYDVPAAKDGRLVKELVKVDRVKGMQAYVLNTRRPAFQDIRVRRALNFAFDFEWSNANLFYGQYTRCRSYFNNSEMEAKGLPSPAELALLTPLKDQIPPEVFTTEFTNPVNANGTDRRKNLREASRLLADAGWTVMQDGGQSVLKNAKGETLAIEFLLYDPTFERITLPYKKQLELLGVVVTIKTIDTAQYLRRVESFDYDVIVGGWGQSLSPGNEQRGFWGSASADKNGSSNYIGVKNPAIDSLVESLVTSKTRADLVVACQALDRVLTWGQYVVPMWFVEAERLAYWNRFGRPEVSPAYAISFPTCWWWDAEKAAKTKAG